MKRIYRYNLPTIQYSRVRVFRAWLMVLAMLITSASITYASQHEQAPYTIASPLSSSSFDASIPASITTAELLALESPAATGSTAPANSASTDTQNQAATTSASFKHFGIQTTIFWVGEGATRDNGYIANSASAWDEQWLQHYGGVDAQTPRNGFLPAAFTPKENPFYFALPYSDIADNGSRRPSAILCPNGQNNTSVASWCKNSWIAIRNGDKTVYAQWEDVGPYLTNDTAYVFGSAQPSNTFGVRAGLDVSPAVAQYLGLNDVSKTDWGFIDASAVPNGPWKTTITTSTGTTVN